MTETPIIPDGRAVFDCIDGHTCGNPVRLVKTPPPALRGATMSDKRVEFIKKHDWIRTSLMFEPRGHDMMSGAFLLPSTRNDCDTAILYIETSGCLPVCGHGTIGAVTFALEYDLVEPKEDGKLVLDAPAGRVVTEFERDGKNISKVRLFNVPSYLAAEEVKITVPELGELVMDVAYGGNFYAIIEPQKNYGGLEDISADQIIRLSPIIRKEINKILDITHPEDSNIAGVSHVEWIGAPQTKGASGRNAVFYGEKAIDRSPCGTGTSARMAQLAARGQLNVGDEYFSESIIGTIFEGRVEAETSCGLAPAISPSIAGWARVTGENRIFVDERDPLAFGFTVK